jgi:putative molybdopterin biosynthesis protein
MAWKSIRQTADLLGVHYNTVYRMVRRGELEAYKVGRIIRISDEDIEEWKRRNTAVERMVEI